ncbi:hypothetical protein [uncultured Phenylobacterium sp.]|nr:hypothetical protein [uncultured Phenylobacterium sp.]
MITPFLMLVLAGYAVFVLVLGGAWVQQVVADRRLAQAKRLDRR